MYNSKSWLSHFLRISIFLTINLPDPTELKLKKTFHQHFCSAFTKMSSPFQVIISCNKGYFGNLLMRAKEQKKLK